MIADLDLALELPASTLRLPSFVDCMLCSRTNIGRGKVMCGECSVTYEPTPLRSWRMAMERSLVALEEETGLTKRTLLRADAGHRMSRAVAKVLARHTGIDWRVFRLEES